MKIKPEDIVEYDFMILASLAIIGRLFHIQFLLKFDLWLFTVSLTILLFVVIFYDLIVRISKWIVEHFTSF